MAALLAACSPKAPPAEVLRPVRTVELRFDAAQQANRFAATVRARHEVNEAFRVGGKIAQRKVEVGQVVREGDVLAVIEDIDYKLAADAAQQAAAAAASQARQAESDHKRLEALKVDGSVSESDGERARTAALTAQANAEAEMKKLDIARNRLKYTVLRASRNGVVTDVSFQVGQVVAEGVPVLSIAGDSEPEIVVDVPEDQVTTFRKAQFKATLASAPDEAFDVVLRELAPQAAAQTRTYRARLKPASARMLPLGATATLLAKRPVAQSQVAAIPATAITQNNGQPAVWVVRSTKEEASATVELAGVKVNGFANEQVFVSGLPTGTLVVTAGVQKMSPGLRVAMPTAAEANAQVATK
ncbi:efflux RND transporter periplasmic adaptor subunit [Hydrogenophaga sp.]|uniref:efflux RND transporter periplasmic adaptor subunit n=1 Tax=Hydrogenophaga sp. TaxID=1904254 RepID=UPI0025B988F2|nr:efflux RND transporter periplasmic adaptor subunit [Hydrogenophaga sp.]